jgi:hypothetical protein
MVRADSTESLLGHGVGGIVFFMCLNIGTEWDLSVLLIAETSPSHIFSAAESIGHFTLGRESIDLKGHESNQFIDHTIR